MSAVSRLGSLALFAAITPASAFAHTGVADANGFAHGVMHPVGGLDHILAMVAVGMFAAYLGGRALWLVPATFLAMMAVGGLLGLEAVDLPFVETGIAASVVVLGLALAMRWTPPIAGAMALAGAFALFHGHAHGEEIPADASGLGYASGFMLATALLHAIGIGLGVIGAEARVALRVGGGAIAAAGAVLLVNPL